jgi:hypothetical protein
VEEPQRFPETATEPDVGQTVCPTGGLDDVLEPELPHTPRRPIDDLRVTVRDTEDPAAVAALSVEYPCKESLAPLCRSPARPCDGLIDGLEAFACLVPNRANLAFAGGGCGENELLRVKI